MGSIASFDSPVTSSISCEESSIEPHALAVAPETETVTTLNSAGPSRWRPVLTSLLT